MTSSSPPPKKNRSGDWQCLLRLASRSSGNDDSRIQSGTCQGATPSERRPGPASARWRAYRLRPARAHRRATLTRTQASHLRGAAEIDHVHPGPLRNIADEISAKHSTPSLVRRVGCLPRRACSIRRWCISRTMRSSGRGPLRQPRGRAGPWLRTSEPDAQCLSAGTWSAVLEPASAGGHVAASRMYCLVLGTCISRLALKRVSCWVMTSLLKLKCGWAGCSAARQAVPRARPTGSCSRYRVRGSGLVRGRPPVGEWRRTAPR